MITFMILLIVADNTVIEKAYEFPTEADCKAAVLEVRQAYRGKQEQPIVFCSPKEKAYNPGSFDPLPSPPGYKYEKKGQG